jgi:hypothetical protein
MPAGYDHLMRGKRALDAAALAVSPVVEWGGWRTVALHVALPAGPP